jgi:hypothetical protein
LSPTRNILPGVCPVYALPIVHNIDVILEEFSMSACSSGPEKTNKRQYLRLPRPYRVQARELVFPIAKDPLMDVQCADISKGGLCVESRSPLPLGTLLHVSVHIPLLNKFSNSFFKVHENDVEQYFQAIADVAWVKGCDGTHLMGLQFVNADEELCQALGRMVDDAFSNMA